MKILYGKNSGRRLSGRQLTRFQLKVLIRQHWFIEFQQPELVVDLDGEVS